MDRIIKTYDGWKDSKLSEYLQIGDLVDEDMFNYFLNVLPPATLTHNIIQIGEAYDHYEGQPTYITLKRTPEGWEYAGHCLRGQVENKVGFFEALQIGREEQANEV